MVDDAAASARVGTILNDRWLLEKLLGVGGMGAVYAARHTRNGARAAVKILHPELARLEDVRERFLQEGRAANIVQHPGVVKVNDDDQIKSGPDAGTTYLVMDLLAGESLEDRLERGPPVDERELLRILDAVLDVLAAAHARGVVHRDLKPENLFLAKNEASGDVRWMVLDFGLARLLDANVITRHGIAVGTPAYMSPEQAAGRRDEIDGRTDIFALAATAFRVLTGRRVHEAGSPVEVVLKMASVPAPPIRDVSPQVSEHVARVIDRALAFRREDRFPDAVAMRAGVGEALAASDPSAALKTVVEVDAPTIVAAPVPAPAPLAVPLDPTLEISASEIEPATRADLPGRPAARPEPPPPRSPPERPRDAPPASSRPRRPSLIPIVTALVLGGLVVKLAMDAEESRRSASETPDASTPSTLASAGAFAPPREQVDAEVAEAPATESVLDSGAEGDIRDAQPAEEEAEEDAVPDAGGRSVAAIPSARAERSAIDLRPKGGSERRAPASPVSAGAAHGAPSPQHRPVHPKPRPKRGD